MIGCLAYRPDMASPVGGEQDPVRQVSVLVHRSDGSSQALDPVPTSFPSMSLPRPPPAVERGGGAHTLRSLLRRVWQGGEELGSSTRRLEVSFSTGQPQAGHLEAMPSQEGMINQGAGPGTLRDEPLPAGPPSVSALPGALPAPSDDANLADEAEHHRLSTSIGLDLADLGGGVEINAPYLALMLLIFAWRSAAVLALWAGLTTLLRRLNRAATAALTDKGAADARALLGRGLAAVLAAVVCAAYLLRPAGRLEAARRGFWATLLLVVAADTCFRLLVAAAKVGWRRPCGGQTGRLEAARRGDASAARGLPHSRVAHGACVHAVPFGPTERGGQCEACGWRAQAFSVMDSLPAHHPRAPYHRPLPASWRPSQAWSPTARARGGAGPRC